MTRQQVETQNLPARTLNQNGGLDLTLALAQTAALNAESQNLPDQNVGIENQTKGTHIYECER